MDGDSLKGALFKETRRLSSGRRIKPKRTFSPDHFVHTSLVQKKNIQKSNKVTLLYDVMTRETLRNQLSLVPMRYFDLSPDFFLEEVATTSCASKKNTLFKNNQALFANFKDFIDCDALTNVYEKQFPEMKSMDKNCEETQKISEAPIIFEALKISETSKASKKASTKETDSNCSSSGARENLLDDSANETASQVESINKDREETPKISDVAMVSEAPKISETPKVLKETLTKVSNSSSSRPQRNRIARLSDDFVYFPSVNKTVSQVESMNKDREETPKISDVAIVSEALKISETPKVLKKTLIKVSNSSFSRPQRNRIARLSDDFVYLSPVNKTVSQMESMNKDHEETPKTSDVAMVSEAPKISETPKALNEISTKETDSNCSSSEAREDRVATPSDDFVYFPPVNKIVSQVESMNCEGTSKTTDVAMVSEALKISETPNVLNEISTKETDSNCSPSGAREDRVATPSDDFVYFPSVNKIVSQMESMNKDHEETPKTSDVAMVSEAPKISEIPNVLKETLTKETDSNCSPSGAREDRVATPSDDFVYFPSVNKTVSQVESINKDREETPKISDVAIVSEALKISETPKVLKKTLIKVSNSSFSRPQRNRIARLSDDFVYLSPVNKTVSQKIVQNEQVQEEPKMPVIAIDSVVMNNQTRKRKVGRPTLESINEAKRAKIPSINTLSRRRKEEERRRKQKKIMDAKPKIRFAAMRKANLTAKIYSTNNGISAILPVKPKPTRQMSRRPGLFNKLKLPLSIKTENVEHRRGDTKQLLSLRADKVFYPAYGFSPLFEESPVPSTSFDFKDLLARRRVLNPLARGIFDQSPVQHFYKDFFYREIFAKRLVDSIEEQANGKEMVDICGDSVNERMDLCQDEFLVFSPAEACAVDIHKALPNRSEFEFLHESTATLDATLLKRALNERVDVAEHLTTLLRFIFLQRLADLSTLNVCAGASMFYSISLANANRLRESLRLYNKSRISCMIDAHCWLLKNLPTYFLASYLNLLRFLKTAGSTLSEYVLEKCALPEFSRANALISEFLSVKVYDPPTNSTAKIMHGIEPIKNICLLLVYPQFTNESYRHSTRPYDPLFKNLLPRIVQVAEKVDLRLELDLNATESAEICTRLCVQLIVKRVREIVKRRPNDHVFLAGWGTSCLLNHKALSYVSGVSGVLDFAFPTETATGPRGDVEDDICLTYCPTLFIVGENACDANLTTLQQLRSNMIMESGLILVGEANQNLFVSNHRLNLERISQKMVDRSIMEEIICFMRLIVDDLGPATTECREILKPLELPHIYDVDMSTIKHGPLNTEKSESKRAALMDKAATPNDSEHQYAIDKPRRKYTKSQKPRKKKNETIGLDADEEFMSSSFLSGPPPGFCTPIDSVPVAGGDLTNIVRARSSSMMENNNRQQQATNRTPLTSARDQFNNSLKKATGSDVNNHRQGGGERMPSNESASEGIPSSFVKIPTPSMLNQHLPPPLPTINSMMKQSVSSSLQSTRSTMKTSPIPRSLPTQPSRPFKGDGSTFFSSPSLHLSPSASVGRIQSQAFSFPTATMPDNGNSYHHLSISAMTKENEEQQMVTAKELLEEEQAAAAALLGQLQ